MKDRRIEERILKSIKRISKAEQKLARGEIGEDEVRVFICHCLIEKGLRTRDKVNPWKTLRNLARKGSDFLHIVAEVEQRHPLQPDIDILFYDNREKCLHAVELKYFAPYKGRTRLSYYEGIDEALALLLYGVDYAHLWHFFIRDVPDTAYHYSEIVLRYAKAVKNLVEGLDLPIGYEARTVWIEEERKGLSYGKHYKNYKLAFSDALIKLNPRRNPFLLEEARSEILSLSEDPYGISLLRYALINTLR